MRANGQASGPVLTSLFLFVPDHSGMHLDHSVDDAAVTFQLSFSGTFISIGFDFTFDLFSDFSNNVMCGLISAEKLATMTSEEMASSEMKGLR